MAKPDNPGYDFNKKLHKENISSFKTIDGLLSTIQTKTYGMNTDDTLNKLDREFNTIMQTEIGKSVDMGKDSLTDFISKIWSESNKSDSSFQKDIENMINGTDGEIEAFLSEAYKNRLIKQNDIHEVASQLSELKESIGVTRDAIVTSDLTDGKISRNITFGTEVDKVRMDNIINSIQDVEKRFDLHNKIKNFIIPKTLEYGEYYAYVIPYSDIFKSFNDSKKDYSYSGQMGNAIGGVGISENVNDMDFNHEHTLLESANDEDIKFMTNHIVETYKNIDDPMVKDKKFTKEIEEDVRDILGNIITENSPVPLCILEEGFESVYELYEQFTNGGYTTEADKVSYNTLFNNVINQVDANGVSGVYATKKRERKENFKEFNESYVKFIEPTRIIPVKIMDTVLGYYYIQDQDITPLTGVMTSTVYYTRYDDNRKEKSLIETIASQVVKSFDKKFLKKNAKFKDLIVNALNYYKLHEKRIRFQFIPKEYIIEFKVNPDLEGNGTSMLEPSLFYAKLYLMLLLFKMISIIQNSNDSKINYIKTSGIDKNVINKVNEIARKKQQRTINMTDMMCYTSMINKVGAGHEIYIPVGRSGERGIETEVISGQDIQLNTDLMDMLKKQMITATGVPDVLMNYINEADFAKTLELANTRFQGRVVSYQLDFNRSITELYRTILKGTSNIDPVLLSGLEYSLAAPKASVTQVTNELLNNFNTYCDWVVNMRFGKDYQDDPIKVKAAEKFTQELAKEYLSSIDFITIDKIYENSMLYAKEQSLNPSIKSEDGEE